MPSDASPGLSDQEAIAKAIVAIRKRLDLTQEQAAGAMGITRQAWQNYEGGDRRIVLNSDTQASIARALGVSRQQLLDEAERIKTGVGGRWEPPRPAGFVLEVIRGGPRDETPGLSEPRQIDLRAAAGVSIGALELTGDDLHPWASAGEIVIFDRAKFPKQGMGCVMELMDGSYRVGLYERTSNGALTFRVLFPNEHAASVPLTELRGVYAITLRGL